MNEEERKAFKVINTRTRRLFDELEIEKEDMSDEPKIAYLMQEIRANETTLNLIEKLQKENEELKADLYSANSIINEYIDTFKDYIPKSKLKDIIDRIDYDIKKTKEIISNNSNIYTSYRRNDYQIVRLRAMNTKSLDIKKRLQKLLESEEQYVS